MQQFQRNTSLYPQPLPTLNTLSTRYPYYPLQQSPSTRDNLQPYPYTPTFPSSQRISFGEKLQDLGTRIDQLHKDQNMQGSPIREEAHLNSNISQVMQIHKYQDQIYPAINSKASSFCQQNLNNIIYARLTRHFAELKSLHHELIVSIQQQQTISNQLREQLAQQFQQYFAQYIQKQAYNKQSNNIITTTIQSLQKQVRAKNQQIQQLTKKVEVLQAQQKEYQQRIQQNSAANSGCSGCRLLQIKLSSVHDQAMQISRQHAKMSQDNQYLQERVFDLQQQVVGIQLQVQKRLKQALMNLPQIAPYNRTHQDIMDSMAKQNKKLLARCQHYEQLCIQEQQLKQRQRQLEQAQNQYKLKNQSIFQALARNQNNININYQRQHHILLAEQNLSKKIEQLRNKEMELSQWQTALSKQNNIQRHTSYNHAVTLQRAHPNILNGESPRSFGQTANNYQYIDQPVATTQKSSIQQNNSKQIYIPVLPINNNRIPVSSKQNRERSKQIDRYQSNSHHPRNNQKSITQSSYAKIQRREAVQKLRPSASNKYLYPVNNQKQIFHASRVTYVENRSQGKYRQTSPSRSIKNVKPPSARNNQTFNGIQGKLDRLRDELRREIDSIKRQ